MKVDLADLIDVDLEHRAHTRRGDPLARGVEIVDLEHDHVAALAHPAALERRPAAVPSCTGETTSRKVSPTAQTAFSSPK